MPPLMPRFLARLCTAAVLALGLSACSTVPSGGAVAKNTTTAGSSSVVPSSDQMGDLLMDTQLTQDKDLWARIRRGFAMPDLQDNYVISQETWYANRPEYIGRMTERSRKYLYHIVEELERRKMPTELALLPFIESAFNPQAMSSAKASGMWQFIPGTGRDFSLRQNVFRDDRRDVLASTRAALDYLERLYGMFGVPGGHDAAVGDHECAGTGKLATQIADAMDGSIAEDEPRPGLAVKRRQGSSEMIHARGQTEMRTGMFKPQRIGEARNPKRMDPGAVVGERPRVL